MPTWYNTQQSDFYSDIVKHIGPVACKKYRSSNPKPFPEGYVWDSRDPKNGLIKQKLSDR